MVSRGDVKIWETLAFKIIPLVFLIPLTLRVLPQTESIPYIGQGLAFYLQFNIESFVYAIVLYTVALASLTEMSHARSSEGASFVSSLNAGAVILLASFVLGLILGSYVLITEYTFASNIDTVGQVMAYYMLVGILILVVGARDEIYLGSKLGVRFRN